MARISARTVGVDAWTKATVKLTERLMREAEKGVDDGLRMIAREEKSLLRRRSHLPGTPTPSAPGQPPAMISGHLSGSWVTRSTRRIRAHVVHGEAGPSAVQARIQQYGGVTGAGHRTRLPARPYLSVAIDNRRLDVHEGFKRRYARVILATSA